MNRKDHILMFFIILYGIIAVIPFIYYANEFNKLNPASGGFVGILVGLLVITAAEITTNIIS